MKHILISVLTFLTIQIQAQNWTWSGTFLDLYTESDIVVVGVISNIEKYNEGDTSNEYDPTPLKSLTLSNSESIKGSYKL
jgi:hypothetical protein